MRLPALFAFVLMMLCSGGNAEAGVPVVRLGVLAYGTAAWEAAVITSRKLDETHGFRLETRSFAGSDTAKVALQAGEVDLIVTDWLWVARRRADGAGLSFLPFSRNTGQLLMHRNDGLAGIAQLKGKRIGIAGGPLDKSWLMLRALYLKETGRDLTADADVSYGSPPLLEAQFGAGRLDTLLTFWPSAARLLAKGDADIMLPVSAMITELGFPSDLPLLGYAFDGSWASRNAALVAQFWSAAREARELLSTSGDAWAAVQPLMGESDPRVVRLLKDGYRQGVVKRWGTAERHAARSLYMLLAQIGGPDLVGKAASLPNGTFWPLELP